jgi:hypothetical protein
MEVLRANLGVAEIRQVTSHGKWLRLEITQDWLLFNLGCEIDASGQCSIQCVCADL